MKYKKLLLRLFPIPLVLIILIVGFNLHFQSHLNRQENVLLTTVEHTANPGSVSVILLNTTLDNIYTGAPHILRLQKQILGIWFPIWRDFSVGYSDELYCYSPNITYRLDLKWTSLYGHKASGHYRVIKKFKINHGQNDYEDFWVSTEFTIP